MEVQKQKVLEALADKNCGYYHEADQSNFSKIPGSPVAYWVTNKTLKTFDAPAVDSCGEFSYGVFTCNNVKFLRLWHEVAANKTDFKTQKSVAAKWRLLNKGGAGRKWYGNLEYVIDYGADGAAIKRYRKANGQSEALPGAAHYFCEHISWSLITSGGVTFRYYPEGMIFDISAPAMFNSDRNKLLTSLAVLNSKIGKFYLPLFNPTLNNTNSDIKRIPYIVPGDLQKCVTKMVEHNISLSAEDWDAFETSWDFAKHPLV